MNINQLKYFVSVVDLRSFSEAAKAQGVTVQAVSKAIGDLEREASTKLFERTSHGVIPTQAGTAFCEKARPVRDAFLQLEDFVAGKCEQPAPQDAPHAASPVIAPASTTAGAGRQAAIRLELCAPNFDGNVNIREAFMMMVGDTTGFDLDFSLEYPSIALTHLASGEATALVTIGRFDRPELKCLPVGTLPTGIVVMRDHPLAAKEFVSLADLAAYPANMSPELDSFNESILVMYKNKRLLGKIEAIDNQKDMEVFMRVRKGYYFSAVIPAPDNPDNPTVCVPIDPARALKVPVCIVSRKDGQTPQLAAVESFLLKVMGKVGAAAKDTAN